MMIEGFVGVFSSSSLSVGVLSGRLVIVSTNLEKCLDKDSG